MTRSQVISNLITKYDKVVTGQDKSAIELAVFKIAICQLVDATFSGGGGGGGTTIGTVSDGIDGSIDINTIISNLSSIDTRLSSINTGQLTQAGVQAAIQAAADIDTIITRLAAIETNTAGGGGGGGGTSSATIGTGVDTSLRINDILAELVTIRGNTGNVITSYDHGSIEVDSTGLTFRPANSNRKHLLVINRSSTDSIDLFFAAAGVFGNGVRLLPGQSYEMNKDNLYLGSVRAITAAGTTVRISISEGI